MRTRRTSTRRMAFVAFIAGLAMVLRLPAATAHDVHEASSHYGLFEYINDGGTSTEDSVGQGFVTSGLYAAETLHHISVYLQRSGPAENACVWMTLRSDYTGGDLAHACVNATNVPTTASWVDFAFDSLPITPGTPYFFIVRYYGSCDDCIAISWSDSNSYREASFPTTRYGQDGQSCCWVSPGTDLTFRVAVDHSPVVTTQAASPVNATSATLNGSIVDDAGDTANLYFEYGTTTAYGTTTVSSPCGLGATCSQSVSGLVTGTEYHFRACATNSTGTQCGADRTFTPQPSGPGPNDPPYPPSNPSPAHGTSSISTGTGLSWTGGDPDGHAVTYDVYLDPGGTPTTMRCSGVSVPTCPNSSLGGLSAGVTYGWRVVARDILGAVTNGPIWTFATAATTNSPPNKPANPSPAHGAFSVSINTGLSWTGGDPNGDPVTYDVYFNAGANPIIRRCIGISTTSCPNSKLGGLSYGTTYAWKVVARDPTGAATTGSTWSFTTIATNLPPNPPANPSPPHNSTTVAAYDSDLSWTGGDPDGDPVTYDVYLDEGTSATTLRCSAVAVPACPNASLGGLKPETRYSWRVDSRDGQGVITAGPTWTFTTIWKEHWNDHTEPLTLRYQDAWVKVYTDPYVNWAAADWIPQYASEIVEYAHTAYGSMVSYPVHVVLHQGRHHGGHAAYYYTGDHDHRNTVDMGWPDWTEGGQVRDIVAHEIAHVVESTSHGRPWSSPAFGDKVWGDGPWTEFFTYDVAHHMAAVDPARYSGEPARTYNRFAAPGNTHAQPVSGDPNMAPYRWFLNFFHPLWKNRGAAVMKEYHRLVGRYWTAPATGTDATRMNMAQFIHFLSGAAQRDLKGLATHAFGWPATWDTDLNSARSEFPQITYPRCEELTSDAVLRVYQDAHFGGSCLAFDDADRDLTDDFMLSGLVVNDAISSFRLQPGWKLVVYEDVDHAGASREYSWDSPDLLADPLVLIGPTWNDRISSFKLVRVV